MIDIASTTPTDATPAQLPLTAGDVQGLLGFDDATRERLEIYVGLLEKWQAKINLISSNTLSDVWRRHVLDSAQLVDVLPKRPTGETLIIADFGSGAGFPGLVLAILTGATVHLMESDTRKCAFLMEASRLTGAGAVIVRERIEAADPVNADVVTARALAPLTDLLAYAARHLAPGGMAIFLKGRKAQDELTEAGKDWKMTVNEYPSQSDPSGVILKLEELSKNHG